MHTSVLINASPAVVYAALEHLFAQAFNCSPAQLDLPVTVGDRTQTLVRQPMDQVTLTTQTATDTNTAIYALTAEDGGTRLSLDEVATSTQWSRRLNYVVFSLPLIDRVAKKQLRLRLDRIKHSIESTGASC
jgi:hypothetical protein